MTSAEINKWDKMSLNQVFSSKMLLSSPASVKSSGQGGSSDTSHIVPDHAGKFVSAARWGASAVSKVESVARVEGGKHVQVGDGLLLSSSFTPALVKCSFWNRVQLKSVCHCSNGKILELSRSKKHCFLWVSSIHIQIEEKAHRLQQSRHF